MIYRHCFFRSLPGYEIFCFSQKFSNILLQFLNSCIGTIMDVLAKFYIHTVTIPIQCCNCLPAMMSASGFFQQDLTYFLTDTANHIVNIMAPDKQVSRIRSQPQSFVFFPDKFQIGQRICPSEIICFFSILCFSSPKALLALSVISGFLCLLRLIN